MGEVALCILFNHNYEKNLPKLDAIYKNRFKNLFYIMPFYQGEREDVIAVYENSYHFQGYIANALDKIKSDKYDHYLIIGDDLLINPQLNENNYKEFFEVTTEEAFIPGIFLMNDATEKGPYRPSAPYWAYIKDAVQFKIKQPGIEVNRFLPSAEEAKELIERHGYTYTDKAPAQLFYRKPLLKFNNKKELRQNLYSLGRFFLNIKFIVSSKWRITYPMVGSYSDCVLIPNKYVKPFIKYCGIFTALRLFVEVAIPTALAFACPKIVMEKIMKNKGKTYWVDEIPVFEAEYKNSLNYLTNNFPEDTLYIHPVKLSKFNT